MNYDELLDVIKNAYKDGYNAFGVRVLPSDVDAANIYVGADVRDSYDWDFESDCSTYKTTGETLGGACCVGFSNDYLDTEMDEEDNEECLKELKRIIAKSACYGDHNVVLIGGKDYSESGWDDGEQIIPNAKILAIINK